MRVRNLLKLMAATWRCRRSSSDDTSINGRWQNLSPLIHYGHNGNGGLKTGHCGQHSAVHPLSDGHLRPVISFRRMGRWMGDKALSVAAGNRPATDATRKWN